MRVRFFMQSARSLHGRTARSTVSLVPCRLARSFSVLQSDSFNMRHSFDASEDDDIVSMTSLAPVFQTTSILSLASAPGLIGCLAYTSVSLETMLSQTSYGLAPTIRIKCGAY